MAPSRSLAVPIVHISYANGITPPNAHQAPVRVCVCVYELWWGEVRGSLPTVSVPRMASFSLRHLIVPRWASFPPHILLCSPLRKVVVGHYVHE